MHILITGAAGDVGTRLRALLKGVYPRLRISDIRKPANLAADEDFVAADLADLRQVEAITAGIDGIWIGSTFESARFPVRRRRRLVGELMEAVLGGQA